MIKVIVFVKRSPSLTREAFHRQWRDGHAKLVRETPSVARHILRYEQNPRSPEDYEREGEDFDGVAIAWYRCREDMEALFREPEYLARIRPDEERLSDASRNLWIVCEQERVVVGNMAGDSVENVAEEGRSNRGEPAMTPEDLVEIEQIKQLKARYFRLMDQGRWEEFAELFTEDCEQSWQSAPGEEAAGGRGRAGVTAFIRDALAGMRSVHHGHMPEIELTGPTSAVGLWALHDVCTADGQTVFDGAGYYRDEYEKRDGRWLIRSTRLEAEPFERSS